MPWIVLIIIALCISLVQTIVLPHISFMGTHPDLFLIFLVYHCLSSDLKHTFHANWAIGLAKDFFSAGPFGLNTFLFVFLGYIISMTKENIFRKHLATQIMVTFIISIVYNFFYILLLAVFLNSTNLLVMLWKCPLIAAYNSIIAIPAFWLLGKIYSLLRVSILDRRLYRR